MANIAKQGLQDKDIRNLKPNDKRYKKAVGNPKELYIFVYPSGQKTFNIKINDKYIKLKEFREGIYSVAEARKEAIRFLKEFEKCKDIRLLKNGNDKYKFKNLFILYIDQKQKKCLSDSYIKKIIQMVEKYLMPSLGNLDVKSIKYSDLLSIFNAIYNPSNPYTSRLETIHRLINHVQGIFRIALKDRYIDFDPSNGLKDNFASPKRFQNNHNIDTRYPALIRSEDLKEFIQDLKQDNRMENKQKGLCIYKFLASIDLFNTASAKWTNIDFEKQIWTIPANETKQKLHMKFHLPKQ